MKCLHKHHPVRLCVGLLLLGLITSAMTGMVMGAIPKRATIQARFLPNGPPSTTRLDRRGAPKFWQETVLAGVHRWMPHGNANFENATESTLEWLAGHYPPPKWWCDLDFDLLTHTDLASRNFAGWPWPSMKWDELTAYRPGTLLVLARLQGGTPACTGFELPFGEPRVVPIEPNWPGLLASGVAHAAMWGVLLVLPTAVRTYLRRKRGRCLTCGYDAKGLETCPECGSELSAQ